MPTILGTGLFALDIILDRDHKVLGHGLGGSAGNVLSILASLDWTSIPVARLGQDIPGDIIFKEFERLGVKLDLLSQVKSSQTPVIYQHQLYGDSSKTHQFSFACPICGVKRSWESPSIKLPKKSLLDGFSPNVIYLDRASEIGYKLALHYKQNKALVLFEPSAIGDDPVLFENILAVADIVKYADDRLDDLEAFDRSHVLVEINTMGSKGLRFRAPSLGEANWLQLDAFSAPQVIDTSGAGDWCTSGLLFHLFDQNPDFKIETVTYNQLHNALRYGQALSALNCMTLGARGLAFSLHKNRIYQLADHLRKSKVNNTPTDRQAVENILRQGWSKLISSSLGKQSSRSSRNNLVCCHTQL